MLFPALVLTFLHATQCLLVVPSLAQTLNESLRFITSKSLEPLLDISDVKSEVVAIGICPTRPDFHLEPIFSGIVPFSTSDPGQLLVPRSHKSQHGILEFFCESDCDTLQSVIHPPKM